MPRADLLEGLLTHSEPSIRYLVRRNVLDEPAESDAMRQLSDEIRTSARVVALLETHRRRAAGTYGKWQGAHWVALALAELNHPGADARVAAVVDETLDHWTSRDYADDIDATGGKPVRHGVPVIAGRARRCASQQGAALLVAAHFGIDDDRVRFLVRRLGDWQWPDGGWNCDTRPEARSSSVHETLLPLRGLAAFAGPRDPAVTAARRFLLTRQVGFRRSTGQPLFAAAVELHYPGYWHYDLLAGLRGLADAHALRDPGCQRALDLLESRELADGGWPADARWYRVAETGSNVDSVDWGPVHPRMVNPWVTAHALAVLRRAERL
ncbi:hypothetical protein [Nocardia sp. NPDC005366]|uniref:hypothetical protein n=1 Tax=Nocardia sp. NPDC005366 TaxID=3156878 RepID=UPI0033B9CF0E